MSDVAAKDGQVAALAQARGELSALREWVGRDKGTDRDTTENAKFGAFLANVERKIDQAKPGDMIDLRGVGVRDSYEAYPNGSNREQALASSGTELERLKSDYDSAIRGVEPLINRLQENAGVTVKTGFRVIDKMEVEVYGLNTGQTSLNRHLDKVEAATAEVTSGKQYWQNIATSAAAAQGQKQVDSAPESRRLSRSA